MEASLRSLRPGVHTAFKSYASKHRSLFVSSPPSTDDVPTPKPRENATVKARREAERDFLINVLSANPTKRDAKTYLSRFSSPKEADNAKPAPAERVPLEEPPLHIALIKIRLLQDLPDNIVDGLVQTLSQLSRLGISCLVVLDGQSDATDTPQAKQRKQNSLQADRLVSALEANASTKAQFLDSVLGLTPISQDDSVASPREEVEVQFGKILRNALARGVIPVIPPTAFRTDIQREVDISADEAMLALARHFAGLTPSKRPGSVETMLDDMQLSSSSTGFLLDRIILLDPVGGIPSSSREDKAHVFVNIEQEYDSVTSELTAVLSDDAESIKPSHATATDKPPTQRLAAFTSNPFSRFAESETPGTSFLTEKPSNQLSRTSPSTISRHLSNMALLRSCLMLLPASASALLTTPIEAATLPRQPLVPLLGVQTRRPRNPLIFNLLTDKPLISSSLPVARHSHAAAPPAPVTFFKRGLPLTIIPAPRPYPWQPPEPNEPRMSLEDSRIDFPRLLNLIEDSFGRPLDVEHYTARIRDRLAGIIIAGAYEGGALLTWELPPGVPDDGSPASRARMVPYLDKFAVLRRSQGAGGVADIVFSAMVRSCLPTGVCWRSRRNNPVNKWYFERSVGTWKIPETEWTMFWTTEGLAMDERRFADYESVCRGVKPSWANDKEVLD